ncbi:putative phosphatidate phosphatase isoform X2 [Copidosoma floridanum]|uniref:putative phosphatidate phosphatase isoform X2 n=1 Tax=Copidosoma floridanum TaxID=29053 RepID=UPI0006C9CFD5|nr:putative phosphatidate phosphatase isoform X2 [Copidosoma floridanum]
MDRGSKFVLRKILIDFVCLFVVGMAVLGFYLFGRPYKRGFFCNDESLQHPYLDSTVTNFMLYIVGLLLPTLVILLCEYLHSRDISDSTPLVLFSHSIPLWVRMAYEKIGIFGFGAATTVFTTDVAKYTVGRLRPHFMTLCKPNIDCTAPENQHRYIQNFVCTALPDRLLKELRLSFPSGHSSFSAYTMIFLALYLQLRFTWRGSKLLRHFLQLMCLMMAWFTAMTRISDYKHHWSDVLGGSSIGIAIALIMVFGVADLFKEKREAKFLSEHKQHLKPKARVTDYEISPLPESTQVNNGCTSNSVC